MHPLEVDENGVLATATSSTVVATGTRVAGIMSGDTCADWTSTTGSAAGGRFDSGRGDWTGGFLPSCDEAHRLYCLEVDHVSPYTVMPVEGRVAFVSTGALTPDFGRSAADTLCQTEAAGAGLSGSFRALLADSGASALSRFSTAGSPWVRVDGVALADTAAELGSASTLSARLILRADGTVSPEQIVWTGAPSVSEVGADTCSDWSSVDAGERAHIGRFDERGWFGAAPNTVPCSFSALPLYCFEE